MKGKRKPFSMRLRKAINEINKECTINDLKNGQCIVLFVGDGEQVNVTDISKLPIEGTMALVNSMTRVTNSYVKELTGVDTIKEAEDEMKEVDDDTTRYIG